MNLKSGARESTSGSEPGRLNFPDAVKTIFEFLATEHEFRCVLAEPTVVRYESQSMFVTVKIWPSRSTLDVEFGRLDSGESFNLSEVLRALNPKTPSGIGVFSLGDPAQVRQAVSTLAGWFRTSCGSVLTGGVLLWQKLKDQTRQLNERDTKEIGLRHIREEADTAWRKEDYAKLVALYESIQKDLTPAELKRLEYSKKRLGQRDRDL